MKVLQIESTEVSINSSIDFTYWTKSVIILIFQSYILELLDDSIYVSSGWDEPTSDAEQMDMYWSAFVYNYSAKCWKLITTQEVIINLDFA